MTLSKNGQALSENRLGRRSTLVRIGSKPRSHGGQLCKPEQTNVGTGGFCSAVLTVETCSRTEPPYARSFAEQPLPSFQLCGWGRSLSEQQLDTHMCEDTHIHASMPACIQTYNICNCTAIVRMLSFYNRPSKLRLWQGLGLGLSSLLPQSLSA